ncbi:MAG: tetraacyldisaccharide 4'-kinase [Candidatus Acidiferrales bacterium]
MTKVHAVVRWLLWPPSLVYGGAAVLRAWLYRVGVLKQRRLSGVVISVGNLTVGGTGKTPMVMLLAQRLFDGGKRIGILSRGYRGKVRTDEGLAGPPDADRSLILSDETWLMQRRLEGKVRIGVGADRYTHGRALAQEGVEWFILDDGFQHLRLARDANILLIDARDPFGDGQLLPAGRLREPKSAMARADIVVITRSDHAPAVETVVRRYTPAPIFCAQPELKEVYFEGPGAGDVRTSEWLGKRMFVFCGIGNPAAFVADVSQWGMEVAASITFPDHHRYTPEDARRIESRAARAGAQALICTEKDSYNLSDVRFRQLPLFVCRINLKLQEPEKFWQALYTIIEQKQAGKAE